MPIEATPAEQLLVAVATKFAAPLMVELLLGEVTYTPLFELETVNLTPVVDAPPQ
jgi:hypothetical protein